MQMFRINQAAKSYAQIPLAPQSTRQIDTISPDMQDGIGDDDDLAYNTQDGFSLHFDFLSNLERKYRDVRFIYGVYNYTKEVVKNREVGIMQSEPDPANMARNRINIEKKHILKGNLFITKLLRFRYKTPCR
jgi:hypothetical protein